MTHSAGAAAWQKSSRPVPARIAKLALAGAAALLVGQYLAGCFFLWSIHSDLRRATPLTITRYAYYYGQRLELRHRLWTSSVVGFALVLTTWGVSWLPRRRGLHGDARFASRAEIAAAGLFGREGIILGRRGRRYLMLEGQQGVSLAAPPRAGRRAAVCGCNRHRAATHARGGR